MMMKLLLCLLKKGTMWNVYVTNVRNMFVSIDITIIRMQASERFSPLKIKCRTGKINWNSFEIENKTLCWSCCQWIQLYYRIFAKEKKSTGYLSLSVCVRMCDVQATCIQSCNIKLLMKLKVVNITMHLDRVHASGSLPQSQWKI